MFWVFIHIKILNQILARDENCEKEGWEKSSSFESQIQDEREAQVITKMQRVPVNLLSK